MALAAKESLRLDTDRRIHGLREDKSVKYDMTQIVSAMSVMDAIHTDQSIKRDRWLDKFAKVLLVEHPFEKLVATYENKFKTRSGFLGYIVGKRVLTFTRGQGGTVNVSKKIMEESPVRFHEMIDFMLKRNIWDAHWKSIYDVCHPCNIRYDYVIKVDTFASDVKNLLKVLYDRKDLAHVLGTFPVLKKHSDVTVDNLMHKHYRTLTPSELLILHDMFNVDMFMFQYRWPFRNLSVAVET